MGAAAIGAGDDVLDLGKDGGFVAVGDNHAVGDVRVPVMTRSSVESRTNSR